MHMHLSPYSEEQPNFTLEKLKVGLHRRQEKIVIGERKKQIMEIHVTCMVMSPSLWVGERNQPMKKSTMPILINIA